MPLYIYLGLYGPFQLLIVCEIRQQKTLLTFQIVKICAFSLRASLSKMQNSPNQQPHSEPISAEEKDHLERSKKKIKSNSSEQLQSEEHSPMDADAGQSPQINLNDTAMETPQNVGDTEFPCREFNTSSETTRKNTIIQSGASQCLESINGM